jgi:ubiquinone/menaquinone biosynthesis C-methylase UbiE
MTALSMSKPSKPEPYDARNERARREARFWDRVAAGYARKPVGDPAAYEHKLSIMRELLDATPCAQVVEIGCGTGSTAITLAPHTARIRATDISPSMIAIALDKARAAGVENVDFEVAALEDVDVPPESQDIVMANSILHLVGDRDAALDATYRWLRPGGVFVASTPCLAEQAPWLRPFAWLAHKSGFFPPMLRFFSEAQLRASLEGQGFIVETRFRPGPKAAVFLVARKPS